VRSWRWRATRHNSRLGVGTHRDPSQDAGKECDWPWFPGLPGPWPGTLRPKVL